MTAAFKNILLFQVVTLYLLPSSGRSDVVQLNSGEKIEGTTESLSGDTLKVRLTDGETKEIPKKEISSILFGPSLAMPPPSGSVEPESFLSARPMPQGKYSSPSSTFQVWRSAAIQGNLEQMVSCYAAFRQKDVRKQLKQISKEKWLEMKDTTQQTIFSPNQPMYQGDHATLEVNWTKGLLSDTQLLQFVLEGNDWKIVQ